MLGKYEGQTSGIVNSVADPDPDPGRIRIQSGPWIRIRIQIRIQGQEKKRENEKISKYSHWTCENVVTFMYNVQYVFQIF